MSSTNVHSNNNLHICAGQAVPTERGMDVPPENAKIGPKKIEVMEGPNAVISVLDNIVVKEGKNIIGRASTAGQVLSGDSIKVKRAISNREIGRD